jgi:hypothetical protein
MGGSAAARPSSDWNEPSAHRRNLAKPKIRSRMQKSPELKSEMRSLDTDSGGSVRTDHIEHPVSRDSKSITAFHAFIELKPFTCSFSLRCLIKAPSPLLMGKDGAESAFGRNT